MKRTIFLLCFATFILLILSSNVLVYGETQEPIYGQLSVKDGLLCGQNGKPVQLVGFSTSGLQRSWYPGFINDRNVSYMKNNWNVNVVRAAMYTATDWFVGGYCSDPSVENEVDRSVDAAVNNGIYVIVDWHILSDNDPWMNIDKAVEFFTSQAKKHGKKPNVIFEICNEPNKVRWDNSIKPYAERIIPIIRQYSNNIIVIGTPDWSQGIDKPMSDPVAGDNLMYALHFYAGESSHEGLKERLKQSQESKNRLPVFVTEFGTTGASGTNNYNEGNTIEWLNLLKKYNISWCNWSLSNKSETCSALQPWTGFWSFSDANLTQSGKTIVNYLTQNYARSMVANSPDLDSKESDFEKFPGSYPYDKSSSGNFDSGNRDSKQYTTIGFSPEEYRASEFYDSPESTDYQVIEDNEKLLDNATPSNGSNNDKTYAVSVEEPSFVSRTYKKVSEYIKNLVNGPVESDTE